MDDTGVYIGTSGWTYPDWDGEFYPPGVRGAKRLPYYAARFNALEINATFYRLPNRSMLAAWNRSLEAGYHLVLKAHRAVTHLARLKDCQRPLAAFLERALDLRALKVILWQLPPSLPQDLPRLEGFLGLLPKEVRHAVEFRHASWWREDTARVLARHGAAMVAVSHPRLPPELWPTADFLYLRLHGLGPELYKWDYSRDELAAWGERLRPHLPGRELYVFFNNTWQARAAANAQAMRALLAG